MRRNIERRSLEGIRLTGYRRGEVLAASYASGDAFVFPSDTETVGNVVMEAFASGLVGASMYTARSEIYS